MFRLAAIASLCCSAAALAQNDPDDEWGSFPLEWNEPPVTPQAVPPPVPPLPPPPPAPRPSRAAPPRDSPRAGLGYSSLPSSEPNQVSIFGAPTLGQWKRGQAIFLGFPLLGLRLAIGLSDRVDLSVAYQSFFAVMNEFQLGFKVGIFRASGWAVSVAADGMFAVFAAPQAREGRGSRWITGHRNFGVSPGLIGSFQRGPRSARLFLDARYLLTFDTEPFPRDPLSGVPPRVALGHNALVHFGAELPLSAKTSFVFLFGLDLHGRPEDARLMPAVAVGLVTGI